MNVEGKSPCAFGLRALQMAEAIVSLCRLRMRTRVIGMDFRIEGKHSDPILGATPVEKRKSHFREQAIDRLHAVGTLRSQRPVASNALGQARRGQARDRVLETSVANDREVP